MREGELLDHIYGRSADLRAAFPAVVVGPGDDCAVVNTPRGDCLLLTVDQVVEGRHIALEERIATQGRGVAGGASLEQVAHKAIARSISDVAAMGGRPAWALATGLLPPDWPHGDALFDAMARAARGMSCPLVGGDIAMWGSSGEATEPRGGGGGIVLTVTVGGLPHEARGPVLRSGARAGDIVCVTGALGGSLRSGRHLSFVPRVVEASWLCDLLGGRLHAMIDLSDGLGLDGARVGRASRVVLEIDAEAIPLQADAAGWRGGAGDGEDYELLFTVDPEADLPARCPLSGVLITRIGRVVQADGSGGSGDAGAALGCRIITPEGEAVDGASLGWDHGA